MYSTKIPDIAPDAALPETKRNKVELNSSESVKWKTIFDEDATLSPEIKAAAVSIMSEAFAAPGSLEIALKALFPQEEKIPVRSAQQLEEMKDDQLTLTSAPVIALSTLFQSAQRKNSHFPQPVMSPPQPTMPPQEEKIPVRSAQQLEEMKGDQLTLTSAPVIALSTLFQSAQGKNSHYPLGEFVARVKHAGKGNAEVLCLHFKDKEHFYLFDEVWEARRKQYGIKGADILFTEVEMDLAEGGVFAFCVFKPLKFDSNKGAILGCRDHERIVGFLLDAKMIKNKLKTMRAVTRDMQQWLENNFKGGDFYKDMVAAGEVRPLTDRPASPRGRR